VPKYIIECESGFCGVNDTVIIDADSEEQAEDQALEWWTEQVSPSANVIKEATEEEIEDGGYEEIN
jgi:hypothetical protein